MEHKHCESEIKNCRNLTEIVELINSYPQFEGCGTGSYFAEDFAARYAIIQREDDKATLRSHLAKILSAGAKFDIDVALRATVDLEKYYGCDEEDEYKVVEAINIFNIDSYAGHHAYCLAYEECVLEKDFDAFILSVFERLKAKGAEFDIKEASLTAQYRWGRRNLGR